MLVLSLAKGFVATGFLAHLSTDVAFGRWKIASSDRATVRLYLSKSPEWVSQLDEVRYSKKSYFRSED